MAIHANENGHFLTVLTPAYNRAGQLNQLWASLCAQTDRDFVWLVVDDGSTDGTDEVMRRLAGDSPFPVICLSKPNGGKHTALNLGMGRVDTPLTFIVDSDDTLTPDAVARIREVHTAYAADEGVCGYSFLRAFPDGTVNGKPFPQEEWRATYIDARINAHDTMSDKAEVYKTACLKEFPFPEFEGERFLGEDVVWIRMARKYETVHVNHAIYVGEYQTDGLTSNRRKHNMRSPKGCTVRAKEFLYRDINLWSRTKAGVQYMLYGTLAGKTKRELYKDSPAKFLCLLSTLPAAILRRNWVKRYLKK